jgi:outer membrane lipoprotein-sorting protein
MADDTPSLEDLFLFAREAELRVQSLRMTIEEHSMTARGEEIVDHEIQLRHPGRVRITSRRSSEALSNEYDVWLSDGATAQIYKAANNTVSQRPLQTGVAGTDAADLPLYAQQRDSLTKLPSGTLADTFVHPHGLFRNVLVTGPLSMLGTRSVRGREAVVVRSQHPRAAKVLVDRPDRSIEVGIDRATGFLLLLTERVGDDITHHAEVTALEVDPTIMDSAFKLKLPADVRKLY